MTEIPLASTTPETSDTDISDAEPLHVGAPNEQEAGADTDDGDTGGVEAVDDEHTRQPLGSRILSAAPTVVVLVCLGALGVYGHSTGWKIPGRTAAAEASNEDWCEAHNVPQSSCLACNPALAGGDATDWCKEHGVPESKCTVCHPEILTGAEAADWCKEHGVPESQCTTCHPEIATKGTVSDSEAEVEITWKPDALARSNSRNCQIHLAYVQFASAAAFKKTGVVLKQVQERPMRATVNALAEVAYDQTRVARVATRVPGIVAWVGAEVGQSVEAGQILALVDSQHVGRAKASLLEAIAELELQTRTQARIQTAAAKGLRTAAETQEADAALRKARISLFNAQQAVQNLGLPCDLKTLQGLEEEALAEAVRLLGIPEEIKKDLPARARTGNLIPLPTPLAGVVVERGVVAGEVLKGAQSAFVVADTSKMWVETAVPHDEAHLVKRDQTVAFQCEGVLGAVVHGKVSWISTEVDDRTRTVLARAVVDNPDSGLRANVFGRARVTVRAAPTAIAVPSEAVHWEGCCHIVFVRVADQIFQPRKVVVGVTQRGHTEIRVGLLAGEVVATKGSHVLKSDVLKSRLGAGCADD